MEISIKIYSGVWIVELIGKRVQAFFGQNNYCGMNLNIVPIWSLTFCHNYSPPSWTAPRRGEVRGKGWGPLLLRESVVRLSSPRQLSPGQRFFAQMFSLHALVWANILSYFQTKILVFLLDFKQHATPKVFCFSQFVQIYPVSHKNYRTWPIFCR